jgi:hypothetical protein
MINTIKKLIKHPLGKNILSAFFVAVIGFILLNLAFLFYALVFQFINIFIPRNPESAPQGLLIIRHVVFLIIIGLISWFVFRSKLPKLAKATYLTVPTAVVLVTIGIFLWPSPVLPYLLGGLLTIIVLFYFYRTHKSWLYYYSVILVSILLMVFTLAGGEI